uniref:YhaN AAA domain-containing protein n=1 Tax=Magnetococcus massalia (strain MO-1) TaxID=451514 RepID=A0A1S7LLP5_MAGMO|nr:conserved protein of unknown function [include RecF/RecN/SMC N terminal domain] [Candidatus Magnetococcus massalia]
MRLDRLTLHRYGHFTEREIPLAPTGKITLIAGDNEAGKSTVLQAVIDLLYGIDIKSSYNFLHDYQAMLLGGLLVDGNHQSWAIKRRKGSKKTLLNQQEEAIPESFLESLLGHTDKSYYAHLFALNHERLRAGGDEMARAKGALGEMLFGAYGGLKGIGSLKKELSEATGQLHRARGQKTALKQAKDRFEEAAKTLRNQLLTSDDWQSLQRELEEAEAQQQQIHAQKREIHEQLQQLNRIKRVTPFLTQLEQIRHKREPLLQYPLLPEEAASQWQTLQEQWLALQSQLEKKRAEQRFLQEQQQALPDVTTILPWASSLVELAEQSGLIRTARLEQPKRQAAREEIQRSLTQLAHALGLPHDATDSVVDQLKAQEPSRLARQSLKTVIGDHAQWSHDLQTVEKQIQTLEQRLERAKKGSAIDATATQQTAQLRTVVEQLRRGESPLQAMERIQQQLAERERQRNSALSELPGWDQEITALERMAIPPLEQRQELAHRHQACSEALAQTNQEQGEHQRRLEQLSQQRAALEKQGPLPTQERLEQARIRRDQQIAQLQAAAEQASSVDSPWLQRAIEQLNIALRESDQIADARLDEAVNLASYQKLQSESAEVESQLQQISQKRAQWQARRERWYQQWQALWPSSLHRFSPEQIESWLVKRRELLALHHQSQEISQQLAIQQSRLQDQQDALKRALSPWLDQAAREGSMTHLLAQAQSRLQQLEGAQQVQQKQQHQHDLLAQQLEQAIQQRQQLLEQQKVWQVAWQTALQPFGQSGESRLAIGETLLTLWDEISQQLNRDQELADILRQQRLQAEQFAQAVEQQQEKMSLPHGGSKQPMDDPLEQSLVWQEQLQKAQEVAKQQAQLQNRWKEIDQQIHILEADLSALVAQRNQWMSMVQVESPDHVPERLQFDQQRREQEKRWQATLQQIHQTGDGEPLEKLQDASTKQSAEALEAQIVIHQEQDQALLEEMTQATERLTAARQAQAAQCQQDGGLDQAQAVATSRRELLDVAENWMSTYLAEKLFHAALQRYSSQGKGAVISLAERYFKQLTLGRYDALEVVYGEKDHAVLMTRRDGRHYCRVEHMSDGTKDQLYLALRLAAICDRMEQTGLQLPFLADDLFVHFDDARTQAGMQILADLAKQTQVIFFTHHNHMVELAEQTLQDQVVTTRLQL